MKDTLEEEKYSFVSERDKTFIVLFDNEMNKIGYSCASIGDGYCWGKYMMTYTKRESKTKKMVARIYLKDSRIVLRLYLNDIDKHREYIEYASKEILNLFIGDYANCDHCHNDKNGVCKCRKTYTLFGKKIEKCNGKTFEIFDPKENLIHEYMNLFKEFYTSKKGLGQIIKG